MPVALTDDGWELDAVQAALRQLAPSLAYLVPDSHNPTGFTLSAAERKRLGQIISDTRTRTIVDESISDMWIDDVHISTSITTIVLEPTDGGTRLTLTEQGVHFDGRDSGEQREIGTAGLLDALGATLEA